MNILLVNLTRMVEDSGGVAKVASAFANEMDRRGHKVTLVYSDVRTGEFYYPVAKNIKTVDVRHFKGKKVIYPWYLKLKREIYRTFDKERAKTVNNDFLTRYLSHNLETVLEEEPFDIIISFQLPASKILLCDLKTVTPVITMCHGDTNDYFHEYPKSELPAIEKSAVYQVLLSCYEQQINENLPKAKTVVIGNAIPQFKQPADLNSEKSVHKIVTVGRLVYSHKRPHLLIDAFAKVAKDFPQWNLEFWGASDGKAYYEELKLKIKKHGLQDRIFLRGTTQNVPDVLRQCDIFAMPSAYEGFSLSLGEAMSMGLPVIAYKSCRSIAAIVTDNVHGFLCEDGIEDFAAKLHILMGNKELRIKMGKEGRKLMRNYSPKVIWDTWETLMNRVVQQKNEKGV